MGGYAKAEMLPSLSLKAIHKEVYNKKIGEIAIQRAYANWNMPRLNVLRDDIVTLGINPVQMFGFGRGADKNASDIQLVIDAMDIACNNKFVDTFIIVSGDGGFSPLANKLHEYGKKVIGCGYQRITNKVFENVCDDFIWLDDPLKNKKIQTKFTDIVLIDYAKEFDSIENPSRDEIINEGKKIVNYIANHGSVTSTLHNKGLSISILIQAIKYRLGVIQYPSIGFLRQVDFVRYIMSGSPCKLLLKKPSEYRMVFKLTKIRGYEEAEAYESERELHTVNAYKKLLAIGEFPLFRLPTSNILHDVINFMIDNKAIFQGISYAAMGELLTKALEHNSSNIMAALSCFVATPALSHDDTELKLIDRQLFLVADNAEEAWEYLNLEIRKKLMKALGTIDEDIMLSLLERE